MSVTRRVFLETAAVASAAVGASRAKLALALADDSPGLKLGAASVDITLENVVLWGQFHARYSRKPDTPLTANIVALRSGNEQATLVSLDLLQVSKYLSDAIRARIRETTELVDPDKVVFAATHTHTAPVLTPGGPGIPEDFMSVEDTVAFLATRITEGILAAWEKLAPGKISFGLERNSIGFSRRAVYMNGSATMYGDTTRADFKKVEGMVDDDLSSVFFFDASDNLVAMLVNIGCTSQVVEGRSNVNADLWHPTRLVLKEHFGQDVVILGTSSTAGDTAPRAIYHKTAYARMARLRGMNDLDDFARRISHSVISTFDVVQREKIADPALVHKTEMLQLPVQPISDADYKSAKSQRDAAAALLASDPAQGARVFMSLGWHAGVVRRYEALKNDPNTKHPAEVHVIRLGDLAICTNPFECYCEYGVRIKARSRAVQTILFQIAGPGGYLPTDEAIRGGGYSAIPQSCPVGPEGGTLMVEETLRMLGECYS